MHAFAAGRRPLTLSGFWLLICLAALGLALNIPAGAAPALPAVSVPALSAPPVIDGKLDDAAWATAARISGFRGARTGEPVKDQTTVLMAYDEQAVYFGIRCDEPNPSGIVARATNEQGIWATDDAVAVMLDTGEKHTYYQFAVTPKGLDFDQKVVTFPVEQKLYGEYEPKWDARALVGPDHWSAEMAIPYAALETGPQMGRVWRMNIFRVQKQAPYDKTSFWSYAANSHTRDNWGRVRGIVIGADAPGGFQLESVDIAATTPTSPGPAGPGSIWENKIAASFSKALPADTTVTLNVTTPSGKATQFTGAANGTNVQAGYRLLPEEGTHTLAFTIKDKSGALLYRSPPAGIEIGHLLDSYVEQNYYTRETDARVICLAPTLDAAILKDAALQVRIEKTDVQKDVPAPLAGRTEVNLPLTGVGPGEYSVAVVMRNGQGRTLASQALQLRKLEPGKGSEVKIVRRDSSAYLLCDGKPYFMLGTDIHDYPGDMLELVREMGQSGFNMLSLNGAQFYETEAARAGVLRIMDECQKNGLKVCILPEYMPWVFGKQRGRWLYYSEWSPWHKDSDGPTPDDSPELQRIHENIANITRWVRQFMNHPALLLYHGFDEADTRNQKEDEIFLRFLRRVDPYHPFERIFGPGPIIDRYGDIYNVHAYMSTHNPLTRPYENALGNKPVANSDRKPLHIYVGGETSSDSRGPTAAEYRCQMYLVLIGGGRGIVWFVGRHHQLACWNAVKSVTREISELIPILLEPDIPQEITVEQASSKPVYVWLLRHQGRRWVLAANCRKSPAAATMILPDLKAGAKINVHFESGRTVTAQAGRFSDKFGEYGVHVYEVVE